MRLGTNNKMSRAESRSFLSTRRVAVARRGGDATEFRDEVTFEGVEVCDRVFTIPIKNRLEVYSARVLRLFKLKENQF